MLNHQTFLETAVRLLNLPHLPEMSIFGVGRDSIQLFCRNTILATSVKGHRLRIAPLRVRQRCSTLLLPFFAAHLGNVKAILLQILSESDILLLDGVLVDRRQTPDQERAEETQAAGDEEWVLSAPNGIIATSIRFDDREDVRANKCANLSASCCDGVVLAADSSCASLGGDEPDVVAGTCQKLEQIRPSWTRLDGLS